MKILVLEDNADRIAIFKTALEKHTVFFTEHAKEAIKFLQQYKFEVVFFDHDLGQQEMVKSGDGTGYEVAVFLHKNPKYMPKQVIIHSFNPIGAANMKLMLPNAIVEPGIWLKLKDMV